MPPYFFMKYSYESCFATALKFKTKKEFKEQANGEYQWLCRTALIDEACNHMDALRRTLSDADIAEIAKRYTHRRAFKLGDQSAYASAKKRGILNDVCAHMVLLRRRQTDEQIAAIALKFTSRSDFVSKDNGAYQAATKRGILEAICAHMEGKGDRRLTSEEIHDIASKHRTKNDFKLADFGAYTTAIRRGILDSACLHMEYGGTGFDPDKPASLYHYRFTFPDGLVLYKIGITNRKPRQRMFTMGVKRGYKADLLACTDFQLGRDARMAEKRLHLKLASHRYSGPPVMRNGNTELFTMCALGLT